MRLLTPDEKFCPDPVFDVLRKQTLLSMKSKLRGCHPSSPCRQDQKGRRPTQTCTEPAGWPLSYSSLSVPDLLSLGLQLKHCEDPVVIDDGDGPAPQDLEQERMSAESQSNLDALPGALTQGPGLLSRSPGQPTEDLGMQSVV